MCGANLCVDINDPANAALLNVGGFRVINHPSDRLIVVHTTATDFDVLSAVCTHNGCAVRFEPAANQFACPCHGSRFSLAGSVVKSPATRALKKYVATFDGATSTLTIVL